MEATTKAKILGLKKFKYGHMYGAKAGVLYVVHYYRDDFPIFIHDSVTKQWYVNDSNHCGNSNIQNMLEEVSPMQMSLTDMLNIVKAGGIAGLISAE